MPRRARKKALAETDLYRPLHDYLVERGYTVRSEVKHCDIAAVKGSDLIVVETKTAMNVALLAQAVRRQSITDSVYVAIPRPANYGKWYRQNRGLQRLLRRLELGLILVSLQPGKPPVQVLFHPLPCERRKRSTSRRAVLEEIGRRSGDFNVGGSCRRKLVTAYRENAVQIATYLSALGPTAPKKLRALGAGPKTLSILYTNVYGWFDRLGVGLYGLNAKGQAALTEYPELAAHYRTTLGATRD